VVYTLAEGDTLWDISRVYNVPVDLLLAKNKIKDPTRLPLGTKILIPGAKRPLRLRIRQKRCKLPPPLLLHRIPYGEKIKIQLFKCRRKIDPKARRKLSYLLRERGTNKRILPHPGLIRLLYKIARKWPGKEIQIYSGYRTRSLSAKNSRHRQGKALDLNVAGVSRWKLYKFCLSLPNTGCGYYPNSYFVHIDIRKEKGKWIDYSKPGEPPKYGPLSLLTKK
jgi:uncharacterized protein YcbK (DUF882 family)